MECWRGQPVQWLLVSNQAKQRESERERERRTDAKTLKAEGLDRIFYRRSERDRPVRINSAMNCDDHDSMAIGIALVGAREGGVVLRVLQVERASGECGSRRETYPPSGAPNLSLSSVAAAAAASAPLAELEATMALMLKLIGRVGRSISGGGGLLRLFGRLVLLRWENEREPSSKGSEVVEAFAVSPSELSPRLTEGRLMEDKEGRAKSSARGWIEWSGAMGPSGSRSRIMSRTLRAEEDRACRARLAALTDPLMLTPPGPNPNVVLVAGAEGGGDMPGILPAPLGRDK